MTFGGGVSALGGLMGALNAMSMGNKERKAIRTNYDYNSSMIRNQTAELKRDYIASLNEVGLEDMGIAGQYVAMRQEQGIVSKDKSVSKTRGKKLQLFSQYDNSSKDLNRRYGYEALKAREDMSASVAKERANVTANIFSMVVGMVG